MSAVTGPWTLDPGLIRTDIDWTGGWDGIGEGGEGAGM